MGEGTGRGFLIVRFAGSVDRKRGCSSLLNSGFGGIIISKTGVESDEYTQEDIWRILVSASAQAGTVEDTTRKLKEAPCANTVRGHLKEGLLTCLPE